MITLYHQLTFDNPTQLADWLNTRAIDGALVASVNGQQIRITFGQPPCGATVECGENESRSYASPYDAARAWIKRIYQAADAPVEVYRTHS